MTLPDEGRDASFVNVFEKEHKPSPKKSAAWTPRELIDSLSKWNLDEPIEAGVISRGVGHHVAILRQGTNSINLSDED